MINHLYILLKLYPDAPWNYEKLSRNPNITEDIVQEFKKDNPNSKLYKSKYPKRTLDKIKYANNLTVEERWNIIQSKFKDIKDYKGIIFSKDYKETNPLLTWDVIQAHPEIPWRYNLLHANPNITWDIVANNPDKNWNYEYMSYEKYITWDIIQANPDKNWDYEAFYGANPNLTWDIVEKNMDFFQQYIDRFNYFDWRNTKPEHRQLYFNITRGGNIYSEADEKDYELITNEVIEQNPHYVWDSEDLAKLNITLDFAVDFFESDRAIDIHHILGNPYITMEMIKNFKRYPQKCSKECWPYDNSEIYYNPNITAKIIKELEGSRPDFKGAHFDYEVWFYDTLSSNRFNRHPIVRKRYLAKKYGSFWLRKYRREKELRNQWKAEYSASIDLLKMRARDRKASKKARHD